MENIHLSPSLIISSFSSLRFPRATSPPYSNSSRNTNIHSIGSDSSICTSSSCSFDDLTTSTPRKIPPAHHYYHHHQSTYIIFTRSTGIISETDLLPPLHLPGHQNGSATTKQRERLHEPAGNCTRSLDSRTSKVENFLGGT